MKGFIQLAQKPLREPTLILVQPTVQHHLTRLGRIPGCKLTGKKLQAIFVIDGTQKGSYMMRHVMEMLCVKM